MKKNQRFCILCLLMAQLLTLTSCGGGTAETTANTTDTTTESVETAETELHSDLPARDLEGATFTVYTRSAPGYPQFDAYELVSEEMNGDVLNDAIYQRNATTEEKYNFQIDQQKFEAPPSRRCSPGTMAWTMWCPRSLT